MYKIRYSKLALTQISYLKKSNASGYRKLSKIVAELSLHPRKGTGKPERLKFQSTEIWSRRIDKKNRITYTICDGFVIVEVLSVLGHYSDK